eukprot:scaffold16350_cov61-Phaeocystis_antarctica.AAC.8
MAAGHPGISGQFSVSPLTRYATVLSTHSSTFSSSYASTSLARTPRVAPAPLVCINQSTSIGCRCRSRGACMAIVGSAFSLAAGAAMPAPEPAPKVRAALSRQARMRRTSACVVKCGSHGSDVGPHACDQGRRLALLGLQGGEAGLAQRRGEARARVRELLVGRGGGNCALDGARRPGQPLRLQRHLPRHLLRRPQPVVVRLGRAVGRSAVEPGARHLSLQLRHEAGLTGREVGGLVGVGLDVEELRGPARLGPARAAATRRPRLVVLAEQRPVREELVPAETKHARTCWRGGSVVLCHRHAALELELRPAAAGEVEQRQ